MSSGNGQLFIVVQFVILGLLDVPGAKGFLPNRLTYEGTLAEDDLTHQEITEIGLTRAVARYLQNIPEEELPTADTEDPKSWFENNFQGKLLVDRTFFSLLLFSGGGGGLFAPFLFIFYLILLFYKGWQIW